MQSCGRRFQTKWGGRSNRPTLEEGKASMCGGLQSSQSVGDGAIDHGCQRVATINMRGGGPEGGGGNPPFSSGSHYNTSLGVGERVQHSGVRTRVSPCGRGPNLLLDDGDLDDVAVHRKKVADIRLRRRLADHAHEQLGLPCRWRLPLGVLDLQHTCPKGEGKERTRSAHVRKQHDPICQAIDAGGGGGGGIWWAVNLGWEIWRFNLAAKFPAPNPGASCFALPSPCALHAPCFIRCSLRPPNVPQPNLPPGSRCSVWGESVCLCVWGGGGGGETHPGISPPPPPALPRLPGCHEKGHGLFEDTAFHFDSAPRRSQPSVPRPPSRTVKVRVVAWPAVRICRPKGGKPPPPPLVAMALF